MRIDEFHDLCKCGKIKYKYAKYCWDCYVKNIRKNCLFINRKSIKKYYCVDCKKEITWRTALYGKKRCTSCAAKEKLKNPKNHPNWQGGKQQKQRPRNTKKYFEWRRKVFERDNFTCQKCGQYGGKLEAHHIKSWKKYPKLRFKINNGLTLCIKCHPKGK